MDRRKTTHRLCPITLKLLGDFWVLKIVSALSNGEMNYCALQRTVGNVNPVTLTTKLRKLQDADMVTRTETSRTEVTYSLTPTGKAALPVLSAIDTFSKHIKHSDQSSAVHASSAGKS